MHLNNGEKKYSEVKTHRGAKWPHAHSWAKTECSGYGAMTE